MCNGVICRGHLRREAVKVPPAPTDEGVSEMNRIIAGLVLVAGLGLALFPDNPAAAMPGSCPWGYWCLYDNNSFVGPQLNKTPSDPDLRNDSFNDATNSLANNRDSYAKFYQSYNYTQSQHCENNQSDESSNTWGFGISSVQAFVTPWCP